MAAAGTRSLTITIGATEYNMQLSAARVTSGASESDFTTFADAAAGGARDYKMVFTGVQDHAVGSLWDKVWTVPGTSVACLLKPYGNATATAAQPHYSFNATVTEPDGDFIGGEANASTTAKFTFDCTWALASKPTKVIA